MRQLLLQLLHHLLPPLVALLPLLVPVEAGADPYEELPGKAELLMSPGWGGRLLVMDHDRGGEIGQLDKPHAEPRSLVLRPGRYRVVITDGAGHPVAFADVELFAGSRVHVRGENFQSLRLPPPPPKPGATPATVSPKDRYPRALAARPLTLPARVDEFILHYTARFTADDYTTEEAPFVSGNLPFSFRWALTDRIEMRDLGVYGALLLRDGLRPAIGAGAGITGFGFGFNEGIILQLSGWLDVKEHLTARTALLASFRYQATVATGNSLVDHRTVPSLHLLYDAASMFSLTAGLAYDWTRATIGGDQVFPQRIAEVVDLRGGFHVSPARWLDIGATIGPSWARVDGGNWALAARWGAEIRLRY